MFLNNIKSKLLIPLMGLIFFIGSTGVAFSYESMGMPEDYPYDAPYTHNQGENRAFATTVTAMVGNLGIEAIKGGLNNIVKQIGNGSWSWNSFFDDVKQGAKNGIFGGIGRLFNWW